MNIEPVITGSMQYILKTTPTMITTSQNKSYVQRITRLLKHGDIPWNILISIMGLLVLFLMVSIGVLLWRDSSTARQTLGWGFLLPTDQPHWDPVNDNLQAWPFIYGTLITSLFAIILAVPISIGVAVFLSEICPLWLRNPISWLVELLAAVPSVVFGLWGIFVLLPEVVYPIGNFLAKSFGNLPLIGGLFTGPMPPSGVSRLAATLILTIMIIPTISAVTRDVLNAIPRSMREASLALGATRWETIWQIILPSGISGILGASILGLGRALGETMAVTMVIGNSLERSYSILRPGYSMASVIANQFQDTVSELHTDSLVYIGLVLFVLTLILNVIARFLVWRVSRQIPSEVRS